MLIGGVVWKGAIFCTRLKVLDRRLVAVKAANAWLRERGNKLLAMSNTRFSLIKKVGRFGKQKLMNIKITNVKARAACIVVRLQITRGF